MTDASGSIVDQPDHAVDAIRWTMGLAPAACFLLAVLVMSTYPLTESTYRRVVAEIDARRARSGVGPRDDHANPTPGEDHDDGS